MKNYPILNPEHFYAVRDYIVELDNQIWSLVDYIYNFNPNYQILNYTPQAGVDTGMSYYNERELEQLGILTIDETNQKITANIHYLPQHLGIYNNFSKYPKENRFWSDGKTKDQDGSLNHFWKEGTVIISLAKNTLPNEDIPANRTYKNDKGELNYFIARLSALATFYHFYFNNDNGPAFNWEYDAKAEEKYGTTFYTTLIPHQPRFLYTEGLVQYDSDKEQQEFFSYRLNNSQSGSIQTQIGSQWTEGYILSHETLWDNNTTLYEDCICDDISWTSLSNLDNSKIPTYNIGIKDGKKPQKIQINLW